MITGIDHVVILVTDLDEGIRRYRELGFTVTPGGKHPRYTHNALIPFADTSYLELIAFWETAPEGDAQMHRWQHHLQHGGGLIDYAVGSDDLDADATALRQRGIQLTGPSDGARSRPDGQQVAWRTAMPSGGGGGGADNAGALPFVIQDVTERALRVPGDADTHANGVRGIRSLAVATHDLAAARKRYEALLGADGPAGEGLPNLDRADGVYYHIGPHRVDLATPTGPSALREQLQRPADSLYELALLGPDTLDFTTAETGGARLRIVAG